MEKFNHRKKRIRGYRPIKTTHRKGKKSKKKRKFISSSGDSNLNKQGIIMESKNSGANKIIGAIGMIIGFVLLLLGVGGGDNMSFELGSFKIIGTTVGGAIALFSIYFLLKSNPHVELNGGRG